MQVSILIPTYNRPLQLEEALASLLLQDQRHIGEVIVSDDSKNIEVQAQNRTVCGFYNEQLGGQRVRYVNNNPQPGNYPNQWHLGSLVKFPLCMLLHDDDVLCERGLDALVQRALIDIKGRRNNIAVWFGRNLIMDENGVVDAERSAADTKTYGKSGQSEVRPIWDWCLTHSLPPNCMLMRTHVYQKYMKGPRDGNVGDWALAVRMANAGLEGSFVAETIFKYRVQIHSVTNNGRQADTHLFYEHATQLQVPETAHVTKQKMLHGIASVATTRYLRDGERARAWACYASSDWKWKRRLSARGIATLGMLCLPRATWRWALKTA